MCGTRQDAACQIKGAIRSGVSPSGENLHLHSDTHAPYDADRNAAGRDIVWGYSFRIIDCIFKDNLSFTSGIAREGLSS